LAEARAADVSLPFGGVPVAIKELYQVAGWPFSQAVALLAGNVSSYSCAVVERLEAAGAVKLAQTTAPEVGLVGYTASKAHGVTRNPWAPDRTPGGSSGGSAVCVSAGFAPLATAGDGGGSTRIPAGYTGLVGLKPSFRLIPFGPPPQLEPLTTVYGCVSRSVRDTARYLDVTAGAHPQDPFSLPKTEDYERGLGTHDLSGKRVVVAPDLQGAAVVDVRIAEVVERVAAVLVRVAGLRQVDVRLGIPSLGFEWALAAFPSIHHGIAPFMPDVADTLTDEIRQIVEVAPQAYTVESAGHIDPVRLATIAAFGAVFEQADFVICATNPDDPYPAEGPAPTHVGDVAVEAFNSGRLTMPANVAGLPAISVPAGLSPAGLPVGLQVIAPRLHDAELLDLALVLEREQPWPLLAPVAR
ncbi:MAG: amidase, partial [Mycobacteriales bacterium]